MGGMTPLIWATLIGNVECVEVQLDWGAQANHHDNVSAQTITFSADMFPQVESTRATFEISGMPSCTPVKWSG